ncbi:hypothetical protein A9G41_00850 [Gilliamella sp. Nev5-1]|nr:hypothetical protein A9G40_07980 [Gilliamella apicola]OCG68390.1 hypothetical protein A9G41_00850 [Gilliamella apicola]
MNNVFIGCLIRIIIPNPLVIYLTIACLCYFFIFNISKSSKVITLPLTQAVYFAKLQLNEQNLINKVDIK